MCLYLQNLYVLLCTNYAIYVLCSPNYENETCVITCYSNAWGWILFVLMISHMHTFRWRLWSSSSPSGPAPQLRPTTVVQPIQSPVRIPVALLINILHPQFHACNYGIWFGTRHDHKRLVHMYACIMHDIGIETTIFVVPFADNLVLIPLWWTGGREGECWGMSTSADTAEEHLEECNSSNTSKHFDFLKSFVYVEFISPYNTSSNAHPIHLPCHESLAEYELDSRVLLLWW